MLTIRKVCFKTVPAIDQVLLKYMSVKLTVG